LPRRLCWSYRKYFRLYRHLSFLPLSLCFAVIGGC